jgi:flagellar biosynthesis GTPase FlhF
MRCLFRDSAWLVALVGSAAIVAGCGAGTRARSFMAVSEKAPTDYHFFGIPKPEKMSKGARAELIDVEIERLATASWESARERLFTLGKEAIPKLFANIERNEPTEVGFRLVPGPSLHERTPTWTLGQVVHSVLVDFVGSYTNYAGSTLPPLERSRWEKWWLQNRKRLVVYTEIDAVPEYVRKQQAAMQKELARRFPHIKPIELKGKKRLDLDKEKAKAERKERESRRQLEKQKAKRKAAEAKAASRRRRSVEEKAAEAKVKIAEEEPAETEPSETEPDGAEPGGAEPGGAE